MDPIRLKVEPGPKAGRLDAYLAQHLASQGFSRSVLQRMIKAGWVCVIDAEGRERCQRDPGVKLRPEETLVLTLPEAPPVDPFQTAVPKIIREDKEFLVLDKPAGLLSHPKSELALRMPADVSASLGIWREPSVLAWLAAKFPANQTLPRYGLVHRLDAVTSGLLLAAKTRPAYERLLHLFRRRDIEKTYLALAQGTPPHKSFNINLAITKTYRAGRVKMKISPGGREALTEIRLLKSYGWASLLEVRPKTGRTHQIRLHLAQIGCPVFGDSIYKPKNQSSTPPFSRLMLHAWKLNFLWKGRRLEFCSPIPAGFAAECRHHVKDSLSFLVK